MRNIIDNVNRNLRALKTLNLPTEHWDALIIHILSNKLDSVTSREWETYRNTFKDLPTLENLLTFLKNRSDLLETMEEASAKRRHSDVTHNRQKSLVVNSLSPPTTNNKPQYACPLCKQNHPIYRCQKFKSLSLEHRMQKAKGLKLCLNCLRQGHNANACKFESCRFCNNRLNSLLHKHLPSDATSSAPDQNVVLCAAPPLAQPTQMQPETEKPKNYNTEDNIVLSAIHNNCVLLSTALIQVQDRHGHKHTVRALLDNGSTSSFITENLLTKLDLPTVSTSSLVEGLNSQSSQLTKRCEVVISSLINSYTQNINCFVVPRITQNLPTAYINYKLLNIPENITLADPTFNVPSQVDMLLGADIFWSVLCSKNIYLGKNMPTLSQTTLGWLISGLVQIPNNLNTVHCNHITLSHDNQLHNLVSQFFEHETVPTHKQISKEEKECEEHFSKNTSRLPDGRFVVTIPLKESPIKLGESYERALSRFLSLERRFSKDPVFKEQYCKFIKEYITLNHMYENKNPEKDIYTYLLPHHGVCRETSLSTKLRVVFDASAVTTSGLSFNNIQNIGPTVQDDLYSILVRMRQHKFIATADVEKMYRMIYVHEDQHQLQQILWRFEPYEQIKQYKLKTVTYGTASAPYLATRCLKQLGLECPDKVISEIIQRDFYVDDLITGASSEKELLQICKGVIKQLQSGQFHLRKWYSNCPHIINEIVNESVNDGLLNLSNNEYSKTLGLLWSCKEDKLMFAVNIKENKLVSKRTILSIMSQIFDPLGIINPCILNAKTILQKLWSLKITWDENVPADIASCWQKFIDSLLYINHIRVPRCIVCDDSAIIELHSFSDASSYAYSACVYVKSVSYNNNVSVHLLTAKSRVAPLKQTTVPRLELCGALLAAKLVDKVKSSLRLHINNCIYWCDSTIVLGWIKSSKTHLLKPFVFNRIQEILDRSESSAWRYVPTSVNPADIGSRGLDAKQLETCALWWTGPAFLAQDDSSWPTQPTSYKQSELPEFKVQCNLSTTQLDHITYYSNLFKQFSSFNRLQRIVAYVQRFIHNYCNRKNKRSGHLTIHEAQREHFSQEYTLLKNNKNLPIKNSLCNLNPFFNKADELMRVGGRLNNSFYDFDTKHPILLSSKHHLAELIFRQYHIWLMHAGPQLLLATLRHKFWVIGGRNLARKTVQRCIKCCRFSGRIIQPIMGNLPEQRLHAEFPFTNTAVDYAGPVMILNRKGRGSRTMKSYLCIFVCLAVKAVHIELVTDLSSESYLAALNRFIARRGKPTNIFSDNGTNFVGACNELSKFLKQNSDTIKSQTSNMSINFRFSPAYSPHFNGLAEGSVKSFKHHLKRVVGCTNLTYEEMNTVLVQIEAILNSRPLTPISSDPSDLTALTPSHFLIGRTITFLPTPQVKETTAVHTLSRYMRTQQLKTHFWNRFHKEYITELQKRQKWRKDGGQLKLGEMVVVKDERLHPNQWLLGRVTRLHPGSDGVTRVADVLTSSGIQRRAFNRLCPLPIEDQNSVPGPATC
ncbi:uncharacterized protein LOC123701362 isoform X1 [Colias croceus]|uniref:uncharacterized protein LOC123701362 isoform X1 n=1 Tax=Colias crocea TaxID=72248 RepID=UPI001E27FA9B|nr:uncharacterized protein LOC123701362 isoform X1 [Colias croceus]